MSHTNTTTNYSLPQFQGTDKPAWLGDINPAFSAIDTQMKANADSASSANTDATTANTNIGTMANLTTDEKTTLVGAINEVDGHADTAQSTANDAAVDAGNALLKVTAIESALNLTAGTPITSGITSVSGASATISDCRVTIAKNDGGSLCKVYGYINLASTSSSGACTLRITADSGLRPTSDFTVEGVAFKSSSYGIASASLNFKTTGEIDITFTKSANVSDSLRLMACLIFVKDFGD